jgi:uncharacterized protein YndB with AHSA1/START domain
MKSASYHFITEWKISASSQEVFDIIADVDHLTEWWPSVYLDVKERIKGDDSNGKGRLLELYTKGFLPYTLIWQFKVVDVQEPHQIIIEALGDFEGQGRWTFTNDGQETLVKYNWQIVAKKPILKHLSFLLKPIFSANHYWAMKQGFTSLKLEVLKRRGFETPLPRKPIFPHNLTNNKNVLV